MFSDDEIAKHTPMIQAFLHVKKQHLDKLVFYRMGDFYELFFEDAIIASKILGITLTKRGASGDRPIDMAGVPFHAVDTYINKAINKGQSVVICEQFPSEENSKLMERKVTRIVTPGTVLDNSVLDDKDTKYLVSLYKRGNNIELSWINFASGEIWCNKIPFTQYYDEILKINPSEIIISEKQEDYFSFPESISIRKIPEWEFDPILSNKNLTELFGEQYIHRYGLLDNNISCVISTIINYLKETQCSEIRHIQNIKWMKDSDFIQIDHNSKKHLELCSGNNKHTLWSVIDQCATPMGSRMLKEWLNYPVRDKDLINSRLDRVDYLKGEHKPYLSWKNIAQEWCDLERISTRISLRTVKPRELSSLRDTLRGMPKLIAWAEKMPAHLKGFFSHATPSDAINKLLEKYLKEEPSVWIRDGDVIADGLDTELDECRKLQSGHSQFLKEFEIQEKIRTNIPNLKVEYNNAQGFFISISNSHLNKIPEHYQRKQTLKNAERFITKELKEYEEKSLSAKDKSLAREKFLFEQLLDKLQPYVPILQKQAKILAEWDVLSAFADMADNYNYSRPEFNDENKIEMIQARHPVIELFQDNFVPNSIEVNQHSNLAIITGPNMGGKSTVMRQLAILAIMAHIGSYVPAKKFNIGDIDAIYTRIGANDDIASGRSTFMVEMTETAYILNNATNKSLILLDELGRGTATYDGLSLAWSVAEYLGNTTKAYTLFATHYLELTKLPKLYDNMENYHVSAIDSGDSIIFTHLIEKGPANKSYGLHVAKLAGVNHQVLYNAKNKLNELENTEHSSDKNSTGNYNETIQNLKDVDVNQMTPMQAMMFLVKLKGNLE